MLSNVLDLEEAALAADLKHDVPLLDTEAAFPSIAHQCLKAALIKVGIPDANTELRESALPRQPRTGEARPTLQQ